MKTVVRSDWVGQIVDGRFPLRDWLGGSAHSGVFLTEMPDNPGRKAAIKLIAAQSFDAEPGILDKPQIDEVVHPHVLPILRRGNCTHNGIALLYVVTDFADEVLSTILLERALTAAETRAMLEPVMQALSYLHEKRLVHTRLKPSNIFVAQEQLQLSADGICIAGSIGRSGSPHSVYDAPEIGSLPFSPAADAWSLGVTIVEALTQHPLDWNRAIEAEPRIPPGVPEPFARIARACLRRQPSQRCTISEIREMLAGKDQRGASRNGSLFARFFKPFGPASASTESRTPQRRGGRVLAFAALIAAAAVVVVILMRSHAPTTPPGPVPDAQGASGTSTSSGASPASRKKPKPEHHASIAQSMDDAQPQQTKAEPLGLNGSEQNGIVKRVLPTVLPSAQASIRGTVTVVVRVEVDSAGGVTNATLASAGPSRYFAKTSLQAAEQWRFVPENNGGDARFRAWNLHFQYRQDGVEVMPAPAAR
ncbi:MAG: TonB family protein [Acidobacteriota bacterium]|nr:TonB family protein [Acidobacteriota bacterium]